MELKIERWEGVEFYKGDVISMDCDGRTAHFKVEGVEPRTTCVVYELERIHD